MPPGKHAMIVVGVRVRPGCQQRLLRSSWGKRWGKNEHIKVTDDYVQQFRNVWVGTRMDELTCASKDKFIALAGIYQSVLCVRQIARQGSVGTDVITPCIYSLFQTDAGSVTEVFGTPGSVNAGARELVEQLTGKQPWEQELTRYAITLLKLERVLAGRRQLVEDIKAGIEEARAKLDHFPMLHPNLLAHLADIYSRTISRLQPRVMAQGDPCFLQLSDNQNRIRALLLAGVRAAWLWHQVGGNRWQFLFWRKTLLMAALDYLRPAWH